MDNSRLVPHFVADRPMSIRILEGLNLKKHQVQIGIMLQACTSNTFREMVAKFPCGDMYYCGVVDGQCPYNGDLSRCSKGSALRNCITTIADSGVFTKQGSTLSYNELFQRYNQMNVERGIILDVLGDKDQTIVSAKKALKAYNPDYDGFKLIGVAQGKNPQEYVECYEKLVNLGYEEIAIGGLLTKRENTARYAYTKNDRISCIVKKIKKEWPDDRCFTLGVYNPNRHELLEELGVDGADYKGWIFQYKKRYDNPKEHHWDRIKQTRYFIEKNILSRMSGKHAGDHINYTTSIHVKNGIHVAGHKVMVNSERYDIKNDKINKIVIIACGKTKNDVPKCEAKDAYIGVPFKFKREYAEKSGYSWFIMSAKYGLLRPNSMINPNYNVTIKSKKDIVQLSSKVKRQIPKHIEFTFADEIVFLGPEAYVESLKKAIPKRMKIKVTHVTKGLKQGESIKTIKELINKL